MVNEEQEVRSSQHEGGLDGAKTTQARRSQPVVYTHEHDNGGERPQENPTRPAMGAVGILHRSEPLDPDLWGKMPTRERTPTEDHFRSDDLGRLTGPELDMIRTIRARGEKPHVSARDLMPVDRKDFPVYNGGSWRDFITRWFDEMDRQIGRPSMERYPREWKRHLVKSLHEEGAEVVHQANVECRSGTEFLELVQSLELMFGGRETSRTPFRLMRDAANAHKVGRINAGTYLFQFRAASLKVKHRDEDDLRQEILQIFFEGCLLGSEMPGGIV